MSWSGSFKDEDEDVNVSAKITGADAKADGEFLYLKAKGQLSDIKSSFTERREADGLIRSLRNFPMRGHQWRFTCSCSNPSNGHLAVADDRGQIFVIDPSKNSYKMARPASTSVSAMQFLPCRANQLIVSYDSGSVVLVDTAACSCLKGGGCATSSCSTREMLGTIQTDYSKLAPVRAIAAHPTKPYALLVGEDMVVAVWDMKKMRCMHTLECDEPILGIEYQLSGNVIVLALLHSGVYVYRSKDLAVLKHCPLPSSERRPEWLAYSSHVLKPHKIHIFDKTANKKVSSTVGHPHIRCVLVGNNGNMYVWDCEVPASHIDESLLLNEADDSHGLMDADDANALDYDESGNVIAQEAELLSIVELPVKLGNIVSVDTIHTFKTFANRNAKLVAMFDTGVVAIMEVTEASFASVGVWSITSDFSVKTLHGDQASREDIATSLALRAHIVGSSASDDEKLIKESKEFQSYMQSVAAENAQNTGCNVDGFLLSKQGQTLYTKKQGICTRPGIVSACDDVFMCVSLDSSVRLFDLDAALGLGYFAGFALRIREPYKYSKRHDMQRTVHEHVYSPKPPADANMDDQLKNLEYEYINRASKVAHLQKNTSPEGRTATDGGVRFKDSVTTVTSASSASSARFSDAATSVTSVASVTSASSASGARFSDSATNGASVTGASSASGVPKKSALKSSMRASSAPSAAPAADDEETVEREVDAALDETNLNKTEALSIDELRREKQVRDRVIISAKRAKEAEKENKKADRAAASEKRRIARAARRERVMADGISKRAMALFELTSLTPVERTTNAKKLQVFYNTHGEFPARYRPLIWRFLLQLPENIDAYDRIVEMSNATMLAFGSASAGADAANANVVNSSSTNSHAASNCTGTAAMTFCHLADKYPIKDHELLRKLQMNCSHIAHWSPVLTEAEFLPQMIFPFLCVFGNDDMSVIETAISIFMWWGHSWFQSYPDKPTHIADAIDTLLGMHDKRLKYHLDSISASDSNGDSSESESKGDNRKADNDEKPHGLGGRLGWELVSTMFSSVLSSPDWLRLMDYLFLNFEDSRLLLLVPVAILKSMRATLLAAEKGVHALNAVRSQQFFEVKDVLADLQEMLVSTPANLMSVFEGDGNTETRMKRKKTADGSTDDDSVDSDAGSISSFDAIQNAMADDEEAAAILTSNARCHPLPKGVTTTTYPVYDNFPVHLLQLNMKSKAKSDTMEKELKRRQEVLDTLYRTNSDMEADHNKWMQANSNRKDAEVANRMKVMEREKLHMRAVQRIEEEISRQRVESMWAVEKAAKEELETLEQSAQYAQIFIKAQEEHLHDKMELALSVQRHRELAENTSTATEDRMRVLHMRRTRDEFMKNISGALQGKEAEIESKNQILTEEWKRQDEQLSRSRSERVQRAKELANMEAQSRLQDEMTRKVNSMLLSREAKVIEIERSRATRQAKDTADEAAESAERSYILTQKQELENATSRAAQLAAAGHEYLSKKLMDTVECVRKEADTLVEAERVYALRQRQARSKAQEALLRQEWAEQQAKLMQGAVVTEGALQAQVTRLAQSSLELELEEKALGDAAREKQRIYASPSQSKDSATSGSRTSSSSISHTRGSSSSNSASSITGSFSSSATSSDRPSSYVSASSIASEAMGSRAGINSPTGGSESSATSVTTTTMRQPLDADSAEKQLRMEQRGRLSDMRASVEGRQDERDSFLRTQLASHSSSSSSSSKSSSSATIGERPAVESSRNMLAALDSEVQEMERREHSSVGSSSTVYNPKVTVQLSSAAAVESRTYGPGDEPTQTSRVASNTTEVPDAKKAPGKRVQIDDDPSLWSFNKP